MTSIYGCEPEYTMVVYWYADIATIVAMQPRCLNLVIPLICGSCMDFCSVPHGSVACLHSQLNRCSS